MKTLPLTFSALLALGGVSSVPAASLDPATIPAEAQWVAHLDMTAFRDSAIGHYLIHEVIAPRVSAEASLSIDPVAVAELIEGVSVYGARTTVDPAELQQSGVVIIEGKPDLTAIAVGFLAFAQEGQVQVLQEQPYQLVRLQDGTLAAVMEDGSILLSGSQTRIEQTLATRAGNHPNLTASDRFSGLAPGMPEAAFIALVNGLDQFGEMGPQARIFQLSQGLSASLAERDGAVSLAVTLETDSSANATRVQQIFQGLIAIAGLARMDDVNLSTLLRSTVVRSEDRFVELAVAFPSERIIGLIREQLPAIDLANDATGGEVLNLEVVRSSVDATCCPSNLGDEDPGTGWVVEGLEAEATFSLAEPVILHSLDIGWPESGSAFGFTLWASEDGRSWSRRIVWEGGEPPSSIALTGETVRHLRLSIQRAEPGPLGIATLRLNGRRPNLAAAEASTDATFLPGNLFDNDPETAFRPSGGGEVFVEARLSAPAEVREVGFLWPEGGERQVAIFASSDGIEWKRVMALARPVERRGLARFNLHDTVASHLRLVSPDASRWGRPQEIRFFGETR